MSRIEARLVTQTSVMSLVAAAAASMRTRRPRAVGRPHQFGIWIGVTDGALAGMAVAAVIARVEPSPGTWAIGALVFLSWQVALAAPRVRAVTVPRSAAREALHIVVASLSVFGVLAVGIIALDIQTNRELFTVALPVGTVLIIGAHSMWRIVLRAQRAAGYGVRRAVVVASSDDVVDDVDRLSCAREHAFEVVDVVAAFDDAVSLARGSDADMVIVMGTAAADDVRRLAWKLEGTGAGLVLATRTAEVRPHRMRLDTVDGLTLLSVAPARFSGAAHRVKRAFDITASCLALIALAPVLICIAAVIRIDSAGPALFRQNRVGKNGTMFTMLKFRSMMNNADSDVDALTASNDASGPLFKIREDPRVTRVGAFIRRHSLDELPQLINILRGDMSIVGPRPPLPRETSAYDGDVHRRLLVRPGLTGLWQVNGRSDLSWDDSVRLDLNYVENWSFVGDLKIIARTAGVVVRPVGAY